MNKSISGFQTSFLSLSVSVMIVFSLLTLGFVRVESAEFPDYGDEFGDIVTRASIRLQEEAVKRPFRLKYMNDSLEKTARAAHGMASGESPEVIYLLLNQAREDYNRNSFALLLQAILVNASQNPEEANLLYEEFLTNSQTYSEFEEVFLKWGEFHHLRRIVYEILASRGVSFSGREEEIQVRIPYEELIAYSMKPGSWDFIMNIFFIFVIIFGGVGLVIASLMGVEFFGQVGGGLLGLYLAVWISYATWLFDLAFGLPWGWSRFVVIPVFLGFLILLFLLSVLKNVWDERVRPLETGYQRCPHCRSVIENLMIECPICRKQI